MVFENPQSAASSGETVGAVPTVWRREPGRRVLGLTGRLPFLGADVWTLPEVVWCNPRGKPLSTQAMVTLPIDGPCALGPQAWEGWLDQLACRRLADVDAVREALRALLTEALWDGGPVRASPGLRLGVAPITQAVPPSSMEPVVLDRLDLDCEDHAPDAAWLTAALDEQAVGEQLVTHRFGLVEPESGHRRGASLTVRYHGPQIEQAGLLRHLMAFRGRRMAPEEAVEQVFMDLSRTCRPARLLVQAHFPRLGALELRAWRSSHPVTGVAVA